MAKHTSIPRTLLLGLVFLGLGIGNLMLPLVASAKPQSTAASSAPANAQTPRRPLFRGAFKPTGKGMPDDTAGGASRDRGRCPKDVAGSSTPITLLTPDSKGGSTYAERPTFMAYVAQTTAKKVFFSVRDGQGRYHYQTMQALPAAHGLMRFVLPESANALKPGHQYHWSVVLVCGETLRPDSPRVDGWIERLDQAAPTQAKQMQPLERAQMYYDQGIWYDAVAAVADARQQQPGDRTTQAAWQELLQAMGLDQVAQIEMSRQQ
jgi:hypothetical protein